MTARYEPVEESERRDGVRRTLAEAHVLMELASGTGVAAALKRREELAGKTVAFPVSGRNVAMEKLRSILDD